MSIVWINDALVYWRIYADNDVLLKNQTLSIHHSVRNSLKTSHTEQNYSNIFKLKIHLAVCHVGHVIRNINERRDMIFGLV